MCLHLPHVLPVRNVQERECDVATDLFPSQRIDLELLKLESALFMV